MYTDDALCDASSNGYRNPVKGKLFAYAMFSYPTIGIVLIKSTCFNR